MMQAEQLEELQNRRAIRECLYHYHRAVERADRAGLENVYWPDAHESHGAFEGPAREFIVWGLALRSTFEASTHQMHNILFQFDLPGAAVETSFTSLSRRRDAAGVVRIDYLCGRYLDWFEKRGDVWRIARRKVVFDWCEQPAATPGIHPDRFGKRFPVGEPSSNDPLYELLKRET
jgi:ketosteroid isomerase-like protein